MLPQLVTAAPPRRTSGTGRPAPGRIALLTLLLLLAALVPAPSLAAPPSTVSVHDETGAVDTAQLEQELAEVDFRTEVDLVVLVLDVTEHGHDASEDTALNDAALDHARASAPELLSADGSRFADGTVILALDPDNRFLGTYAGEDVKLGDGGFTDVQEAMTEDAQDGDWHAALRAGAEEYADLLLRPWWQQPGVLIGSVLAGVSSLVAALSLLVMRTAARRRVDRALPRLEDVHAQRALTDAAARGLPTDSPYAQAVLRDHEVYAAELAEAERLRAELPAPGRRGWGWGLTSAQRGLAGDIERVVASLDDADDEIIAASDLLHRLGDWRQAWERELEPLRDSVRRIPEVLAREDEEEMTPGARSAATGLADLGADAEREMDDLTARLEADRITPETALEHLDTLTRELSAAVRALTEHRIQRVAQDEDEAEVLREAADQVEDDGYRSVRARRQRWESAGTGDTGFWNLSPVLWYSSWHGTSDAALETHRNPASSGAGTSGFSASGFSGAGSSSRF